MDEAELTEDERRDGADLCPSCLAEVWPDMSLCHRCGAPQDFIAGSLPFLRVLAEGYIYRRAVTEPRSMWSVAGVWVIFGGLIVQGAGPVWTVAESITRDGSLLSVFAVKVLPFLVVAIGAVTLGVAGIWQCTRNYVAYRRKHSV